MVELDTPFFSNLLQFRPYMFDMPHVSVFELLCEWHYAFFGIVGCICLYMRIGSSKSEVIDSSGFVILQQEKKICCCCSQLVTQFCK